MDSELYLTQEEQDHEDRERKLRKLYLQDLSDVLDTGVGFRVMLHILQKCGAESRVSSDANALALHNLAEDLLEEIAEARPNCCLNLIKYLREIYQGKYMAETNDAAPAEAVATATETETTNTETEATAQPEVAETKSESEQKPESESKPESEPEPKKSTSPKDRPIKDWSKVDLKIDEGNAFFNKEVVDSFGQAAVAAGLTERQAKALVDWQLETIAKERDILVEAGAKELSKEWGNKATQNQQNILTLITNIDRQIGGNNAFSKALESCGATCHAAVMKGLLYLANAVSEDSFGASRGTGGKSKPETALEGIEEAFKKARGEK